jgi:hypothetical protein
LGQALNPRLSPRTQQDRSNRKHEQGEQDTPVGTKGGDRYNPARLDGFARASEKLVATFGRAGIIVITRQIVREMDDETVRLVTAVVCAGDTIVSRRCSSALATKIRITRLDTITEQAVVAGQRATRETCARAIARIHFAARVIVVAATPEKLKRATPRATVAVDRVPIVTVFSILDDGVSAGCGSDRFDRRPDIRAGKGKTVVGIGDLRTVAGQ